MTFEFLISVEVKNDALTQEATPETLSIFIQDKLCDNTLHELPWVIDSDIKEITRDTAKYKLVRKEEKE
jgi:hypothetical protein